VPCHYVFRLPLTVELFVWRGLRYYCIYISHSNFLITNYKWFFSFTSIPLIPYSYGVEVFIFLRIYTQSVGLLGRVIGPSQGLYLNTVQHKHRINARARTHDHGVRASEHSPCLRPLGYRERRLSLTDGK
jgi:hypothetical protein